MSAKLTSGSTHTRRDGYWHYPKPSDFQDACDRINWSVALAYTTFGLTALQMALVWLIAIYILLCLDQDVRASSSSRDPSAPSPQD